ncbi:MAG: LD-carboxypeptidase [Pseudanabaenaceae cyanobacterium]
MKQPPFLAPPQVIKAIAPAGVVTAEPALAQGVEIWQAQGYRLELPGTRTPWHYLAGRDGERWQELAESWGQYPALVVARGGYGTMRLLSHLGELGEGCPWVIGFSDATALLWSLATHKQIMSIHAPVLLTLAETTAAAQAVLFDLLGGRLKNFTLQGLPWHQGRAEGRLLPGNLTVATHLLGTPFIPPWQDIILALEDVAEPPYKIDRMLTQWHLSGYLQQVKGIALGDFGSHPLMDTILEERLQNLGIPVVAHLSFGHIAGNFPLVVGARCILDGDRGELSWYLD